MEFDFLDDPSSHNNEFSLDNSWSFFLWKPPNLLDLLLNSRYLGKHCTFLDFPRMIILSFLSYSFEFFGFFFEFSYSFFAFLLSSFFFTLPSAFWNFHLDRHTSLRAFPVPVLGQHMGHYTAPQASEDKVKHDPGPPPHSFHQPSVFMLGIWVKNHWFFADYTIEICEKYDFCIGKLMRWSTCTCTIFPCYYIACMHYNMFVQVDTCLLVEFIGRTFPQRRYIIAI